MAETHKHDHSLYYQLMQVFSIDIDKKINVKSLSTEGVTYKAIALLTVMLMLNLCSLHYIIEIIAGKTLVPTLSTSMWGVYIPFFVIIIAGVYWLFEKILNKTKYVTNFTNYPKEKQKKIYHAMAWIALASVIVYTIALYSWGASYEAGLIAN